MTATPRPRESWVGAGRLAFPVRDPRAVLTADGEVLLAEALSLEYLDFEVPPGETSPIEWTMAPPRVQRFDPEVGRFVKAARLDGSRDGFAMAPLPDGRVLVVGGWNKAQVAKSSTRAWRPAVDRWVEGPLMSLARYQPAIGVLPDGTVLVAGGAPADFGKPYLPERGDLRSLTESLVRRRVCPARCCARCRECSI